MSTRPTRGTPAGRPPSGRPPPPPPPDSSSGSDDDDNIGATPLDLTIQAELKKIKDVKGKFPAANLVAALLRQISLNVNLIPRDVHTNAQILVRSNKVYESIIESMTKLDTESIDALDSNWDLFDNYTIAIPILERILLNLPYVTAPLGQGRSHLPPDTSTQEAVSHIHAWVAERGQLKQALEALKDDSLKKLSSEAAQALIAEYITHRIRDDNSTIKALTTFISKDKLVDRDIIPTATSGRTVLTDVKKLTDDVVANAAQKPPSEELSGIVVRALLTVYIPFAVLAKPTIEREWNIYLRGGSLWVAIKELLTKLKAHIASGSGIVEVDFSAVEALLLKLSEISINTAKEMLDLIKLAAYIPRPYSGRIASMVKAIYNLDQFSRQDKNKPISGYRHNLKQTMETSYTELTVVKDAPYDFQTFSLESDEYKSRRDSIKKLFSGVEPLFTTFGISSEWSRHDTAFAKSVATDELHMTDGKKALIPAP